MNKFKKPSFQLLTILALTLFAFTGFSQARSNNIEITNLEIERSAGKMPIQIGCSKGEILNAFGKPARTEPYYFEMDDKHGYVIKYKGGNFYFIENKLEGFDLDGNDFLVCIKDQNACTGVGQPLARLKLLKYVKDGAYYNITAERVNIDELLSFSFDSNKKVTRITYTEYNSRMAQ